MSCEIIPEAQINNSSFSELLNNEEKNNLLENAKNLYNDLANINSKFDTFLKDLNSQENQFNVIRKRSPQSSPLDLNMVTKMYARKKNDNANGENELPERVYLKRNSLLTEMFRISHFRTIRHVFITIMIMLALQVIYNDWAESGKIYVNFDLIHWCFGKSEVVFYVWSYMIISTTFLVYLSFHHWSNNRLFYMNKNKNVDGKENKYELYDLIWLIIFFFYLIGFTVIPANMVRKNQLPPASSFIVLLEQLRLIMKTYAFVRSNVPRALTNSKLKLVKKAIFKNKDASVDIDTNASQEEEDCETDSSLKSAKTTNELVTCPNFSSFLYFLFAPTLVYRDQYPRTSRIRWYNVCSNLAQCFGAVIYTYYIFARFCIPVFQHFNTDHISFNMFIQSILNCTLPGTLLLVVGFYAFLHCWLNAFAEMTKFADRMFYKDWWNASNYSNYYRSWNTVVHDFLYTYIYKDAFYLLGKKYKIMCQFIIFFVSAAFHEYVLTFAFGFFYPVLFVMFGAFGFMCLFLNTTNHNSNFWNLITWMGLFTGLGGLMCLYSIEWYARQNCSQSFESVFLDYILPRSFTCNSSKFETKVNL